jgi:hypothetical protein
MIRIDTIEDLVRVLDDHPDWREAVRTRLLSRELLDLPSEFSAFVAETRAFVAETKAFRKEMTIFVAETKALMETFVAEMTAFVAEMKAFKAEMYDFVAATNRQFKSMRDDLSVLKGAHARNAAERNLGLIARSMGLRRRRVLDGEQLFDLAGEAGADMGDGAIESYLQADLVFEAEDDRGATVYVALEVSYTANGRDTARAMRNAELVARFTGSGCRAAVASLRVDDRIADLIESGRVAWYRLPRRVLEAA